MVVLGDFGYGFLVVVLGSVGRYCHIGLFLSPTNLALPGLPASLARAWFARVRTWGAQAKDLKNCPGPKKNDPALIGSAL